MSVNWYWLSFFAGSDNFFKEHIALIVAPDTPYLSKINEEWVNFNKTQPNDVETKKITESNVYTKWV